jgi:NAD(P)-dependent dehydrogenase (short-subunit alcohol dehydrogenase family)
MEEKRIILVTGASSGIGAYSARQLAREGWRVMATARRLEDIAELNRDGLEGFYLDYRDPPSIEKLVADVLERTGGRLDAIFNNGGYALAGAVEDIPVEALRDQFEANFFGWHDLTRHVIPVMRAQNHGRIVNCSSILGRVPMRYRGAYCASKYALEGLMLSLRADLAGTGIHVSLIEPGPIESKFRPNSLAAFERHVDVEGSVHRDDYRLEVSDFHSGKLRSMLTRGPDAVYQALRHALEARRPKPHYPVTLPAKAGFLMKRILPSALFYRLVAGQG